MATEILGIDAAWTEAQPSGVVLLEWSEGSARFIAGAASYDSFNGLSAARLADLNRPRFKGSYPDPRALLDTCRRISPRPDLELEVVAVDIPIGPKPVRGRRDCDNLISSRFGAMGCGTHSPSASRPGEIGVELFRGFHDLGFGFADAGVAPGEGCLMMEVYPHPAILGLLGQRKRFPYKVSKASRYWRGTSVTERIRKLLEQFDALLSALKSEIENIPLSLPASSSIQTLSELKKYEDLIDALICAWVGALFLREDAEPIGQEGGVIWIPSSAPEPSPKCPVCKRSGGVVPILFGRPTPQAIEQAERGELVIGGCAIDADSMQWRCKKCDHEFCPVMSDAI